MFKRREKRGWGKLLLDFLYPKGGFGRAFSYVKHRLRRLPDSPRKIARGIFAGVFISFSPFFGMHFVLAALAARLMKGNILAAVLATFVGNPLTFPLIATINLQLGLRLMDSRASGEEMHSPAETFLGAAADLWRNFLALFTDRDADWTQLVSFLEDVFLPYMIGGCFTGVAGGLAAYYLSVPFVSAYQKRRSRKLKKKLAELRANAAKQKQ